DHGGRGTDRAARRPGPAAGGSREREPPGRGHRGGDARGDRPGEGADEHPLPGHAARWDRWVGGPRPAPRRRRPVERIGHEGPSGDQPGRERAGRRGRDHGVAQSRRGREIGRPVSLFGNKYPPEVAARVPPGQRLVKTWPILHFGGVPRFDEAKWDFQVTGLVENPFTLSYSELKALGPQTVHADMHCVTGWTTLDND